MSKLYQRRKHRKKTYLVYKLNPVHLIESSRGDTYEEMSCERFRSCLLHCNGATHGFLVPIQRRRNSQDQSHRNGLQGAGRQGPFLSEYCDDSYPLRILSAYTFDIDHGGVCELEEYCSPPKRGIAWIISAKLPRSRH